MADKDTSGIERLRKLSRDVSPMPMWVCLRCGNEGDLGGYVNATVREVLNDLADQIERERAEELAAAKRDLTDEAREAVERLRMVSHDDVLRSANPEHEIVDELCKAVGVERDRTYTGTLDAMSNRIAELIEHGGKQDVDVAALRELADDMDKRAHGAYGKTFVNASMYAGLMHGLSKRIRKAVEGAPKSGTVCECETHMQDDNSCVGECSLCERNGMVEWVEEHGGLEAVQERIDSFARMLNSVDSVVCGDEQHCFGERVDLGEADELFGAIYGELDKRLMPPGMEWLRYEDSEMVLPSDEGIIGIEYSRTGNTVLVTTNDDEPRAVFATGERVKRPEPEVLGADGEPIKAGETVYIDEEHADMAGMSAIASDEECGLDGTSFGDPLVVKRIDGCEARFDHPTGPWCPASWLTHTPPDTQERIDDDATRDPSAYCDEVLGWAADKIVLHSDYAAQNEAMIADLLRRQRELDAKTTGGAK